MLGSSIKCCLLIGMMTGVWTGQGRGQDPTTPPIPRLGLITSYQRETAELTKRDLALKIIDSGILKLGESTADDVAKIFGRDWAADLKVEKSQSYGIISFAKQLPGMPDGHVAATGWYMVVYYNSTDHKLFDWDLSNVHK